MARLSASQRARTPTSSFGVPSKARTSKAKKKSGNFPMPDKSHASDALREIRHAPASQRPAIRRKANRILGKSSSKSKRSRTR